MQIAMFVQGLRQELSNRFPGRVAAGTGGMALLVLGCLVAQSALAAGTPLTNIHVRDPFILPVAQAGNYYLVASTGRSVTVRQSKDLESWGEPSTVFSLPEKFWGNVRIWAPEMHLHRGRYYLFATFMNDQPVGEQWPDWPPRVQRGTQVLVADSVLGPFKPFANRSHTPTNEMALDGTLWVEDEVPYMVYCQEWVQVRDGGMKLIRLSEDLSTSTGAPQTLFQGSAAPWAPRGQDRYVTDGPALYRSKSGKLFMLWASFSRTGYTTGLAISDSGKVAGPWRQQVDAFFREDGGHPMIFRRFDGALMVSLHAPNRSSLERCRLIEVEDTGETLRPVASPRTQPAAKSESVASKGVVASRGGFVLWQLPNQTHSQMMSYVIRTPREKVIVIDGGTTGDAAYLKGFLAALGDQVEAWFISHAHDDHFGALSQLLASGGPRIKSIYGSLPDLGWVQAHGVGPQDAKAYEQFLQALGKARQIVAELALGQEMTIDGVRLEVLGVRNPEIHTNAINNSSLVLRVSDQSKSVLFTSDLGVEGGRKLLASSYASRLPADYLQMAHHGQNGVAENFYEAVQPSCCLWPTPGWLWDNDRGQGKGSGPWTTLEVRAWMAKLGIERHYVMTQGLIRIE